MNDTAPETQDVEPTAPETQDVEPTIPDDPMKQYYEIWEIRKTATERFKIESSDLQVCFRNMEKVVPEQFPLKVHEILGSIFKDIIDITEKDIKIRVHMDADGLNAPYNGNFFNVAEFDPESTISALANLLNSNETVVLKGGELRINIIRVKIPPAGGAKREHLNNRSTMDIAAWIRK